MWFDSKTLLQYSCCKTVQIEMANFLYNVFKNCNKRNTDKLGHIIKVGYQTPGSRSLILMNTVVIGVSKNFHKISPIRGAVSLNRQNPERHLYHVCIVSRHHLHKTPKCYHICGLHINSEYQ